MGFEGQGLFKVVTGGSEDIIDMGGSEDINRR